MNTSSKHFSTDPAGLPEAGASESLELEDGDLFRIRITPVTKRIGDATVRMLAYNGSIPGPTLRVRQGTELRVTVVNEADLEATVHWHGLRVENRYDGTPETQQPIPIGGSFEYRLRFPDPGIYWYHPHIREDYAQDMGLYGNIVVVPSAPEYWPPVHREVTVALDDVLIERGTIAPFSRSETTHTAMGRFGNVLLVNGQTGLSLEARRGEVVRLYLTNTANTRVFNLGVTGGRMKLVGGDSGHVEREQLVESVVLAPSERVVVDVQFATPGRYALQHHTPGRVYPIVAITVAGERAPSMPAPFEQLRSHADMAAERERVGRFVAAAPDKTLALVAEMDLAQPAAGTVVAWYCPMHPDVISDAPGRCPQCGMKLLAREASPDGYACPMHPEVRSDRPEHCSRCGMKLVPAHLVPQAPRGHGHSMGGDHGPHAGPAAGHHGAAAVPVPKGIEWEDDMVDVNRMTTPANMRWKIIDQDTGAAGKAISWRFRVGDQVKIRVINTMDSDHPMHHPFHIHGAGRFLVLARDGVVEPNLVWKDTVLIPTGQTLDLLLDVTNPGRWMVHCHIAEHHESGMMFSFDVDA